MIICSIDPSINSSGLVKLYLDENLNIIDKKFLGFTSVKKNAKKFEDGISVYYNKKDFKFTVDKYMYMEDWILQFCEGVDCIIIEDYAFGAKSNSIFQIGEFVGGIKKEIYKLGIPIRLIPPTSNKMFWTGCGNANKEAMINKYILMKDEDKFSFSDEDCTKHPFEDVVDAISLCELLRTELKLRKGLIELRSLTDKQIQVFNQVSKSNPTNLLVRDFIYNDKEGN